MADGAYVVDTSVFVRWFVDQDGYEHAREIRHDFVVGELRLMAPAVVRIELGSVIRNQGYRRQRLTEQEYRGAVRSLDDLGIAIREMDADTVERVAALTVRRPMAFYDAVFVELALRADLPLITADGRLGRTVHDLVPVVLLRGSQGSSSSQGSSNGQDP